jgi:hypothetical protein
MIEQKRVAWLLKKETHGKLTEREHFMTTTESDHQSLSAEIVAYETMKDELESKHTGKWVVFHNGSLISLHESFESAAENAVRQFGRGPYLIRQIGAPPMVMPASVLYHPYAPDKMRF